MNKNLYKFTAWMKMTLWVDQLDQMYVIKDESCLLNNNVEMLNGRLGEGSREKCREEECRYTQRFT